MPRGNFKAIYDYHLSDTYERSKRPKGKEKECVYRYDGGEEGPSSGSADPRRRKRVKGLGEDQGKSRWKGWREKVYVFGEYEVRSLPGVRMVFGADFLGYGGSTTKIRRARLHLQRYSLKA